VNHLPAITWLELVIVVTVAVLGIWYFARKRKLIFLVATLAATAFFLLAASVILFNPRDNWP